MATQKTQTTIAMTTAQTSAVMSTANQDKPMRFLKVIRGLAIAEVVLGAISFLAGAVVTGLAVKQRSDIDRDRFRPGYSFPIFGEGIWGGGLVVIAGGIGLVAGGKNTCRFLMNMHMGFSIMGATSSALQFSMAMMSSPAFATNVTLPFLYLVLIPALPSMVLLIVSASFCCCSISECCQCFETPPPQIIYVMQNNHQPEMAQDIVGTNQGYNIQGYQPSTQTVQPESMIQPSQPHNSVDGSFHHQNTGPVDQEKAKTPLSTHRRTSDVPLVDFDELGNSFESQG